MPRLFRRRSNFAPSVHAARYSQTLLGIASSTAVITAFVQRTPASLMNERLKDLESAFAMYYIQHARQAFEAAESRSSASHIEA